MRRTARATDGNRCGHNPRQPRFCDSTRRGRGGHPPIIGLISSLLQRSYGDRTLLPSWHAMNPSGRRRRSERREVMASLSQYLFAQWFQVETRRCAVPGGYFLQVPDIAHLASRISKSDQWKGNRLSHGRIAAVFSEWQQAGYITSHQQREQAETGEWKASPAVRTFTKKFFIELGGQRLWDDVRQAGKRKLKKVMEYAGVMQVSLRDYLRPGKMLSPRAVRRLRASDVNHGLGTFPHKNRRRFSNKDNIDRTTPEYRKALHEAMTDLYRQHGRDRPPDYPGGPPHRRWSAEEIKDNAQRIVDAQFNPFR